MTPAPKLNQKARLNRRAFCCLQIHLKVIYSSNNIILGVDKEEKRVYNITRSHKIARNKHAKDTDTMNQLNDYQSRAHTTKARRQAAGYYATAAHLAAGRKMINQGVTALSKDELETLSTHPHMTSAQKVYFAALAAK
jgi:hypothetical protein